MRQKLLLLFLTIAAFLLSWRVAALITSSAIDGFIAGAAALLIASLLSGLLLNGIRGVDSRAPRLGPRHPAATTPPPDRNRPRSPSNAGETN